MWYQIKKSEQMPKFRFLRLFGERCSGTNFVEQLILSNFPQLSLERPFPYEKHTFLRPPFATPEMLCVVVFRNAREWLLSLYSAQHQIYPWARDLSFSDFLRSEYHSCTIGHIFAERTKILGLSNTDEILLDRHPLTGERIANVIELRNLKNRSFLGAFNVFNNVVLVNLEAVRTDQKAFLFFLAEHFDLRFGENISLIEKYVGRNYDKAGAQDSMHRYETLTKADIQFILSRLDMSLEADLGYRYSPEFEQISVPRRPEEESDLIRNIVVA